jgi:DoxX-like family
MSLSQTGINDAFPSVATISQSKGQLWTGRALTILAVLFLVFDGVMKLILPPQVIQSAAPLGYSVSSLPGIGIALLLCTALYVIPRTAVLGAALLTGYLGGAVASMVRIHAPAFELVFPFLFAIIIWASLWLRYPQLRTVFPVLTSPRS